MSSISEIRCGTASERDALGELHRRSSYLYAPDRVNLEAHPDALGVDAEALAGGRVRVAVGQAGELVGFSVVADAGDGVCALDDLFVEPELMRQGIGRTLVEDAAARARSEGYHEMTVVAHPRNFAFYESLGFVHGEVVSTRFGPATRLRLRVGAAGAEPDSFSPLVLARRWDQLGGRLSAMVNARALAEWLGIEFRFVWPRGIEFELDDPTQIFSQAFLGAFEIEPSELDGRPVLSYSEIVGQTDADARQALTAAGTDVVVEVNEIFDVVRPAGESRPAGQARFRRCFAEIGWSDEARRLIDFASACPSGDAVAAIHVRAGDIVGGRWRHFLNHEKYVPTPFIHAAIDRLSEGGTKPVLVLSDNASYLAWLTDRFPPVITAAEITPGGGTLTATQQALAEILILSRCDPIAASPSSAFSRLADNLGAGSFVRTDSLVPKGHELEVLRAGIDEHRAGTVPSSLWGALTARDICWCLDVFSDTLSLAEQAELARAAIDLDPGFSGAQARFARMATLTGDWRSARSASARALDIAESAKLHDDPLMEALATDVARNCFAGVRRPLRHRDDRWWSGLWRIPRARRAEWPDAEALHEAIDRSFGRCLELRPFWSIREEVLGSLRSLMAMAEYLSDEVPAVRKRAAQSLATVKYDEIDMRPVRPDGLERHREVPMFDPLTRDLDRMALHLWDALRRAGLVVAGPRLAPAPLPDPVGGEG